MLKLFLTAFVSLLGQSFWVGITSSLFSTNLEMQNQPNGFVIML